MNREEWLHEIGKFLEPKFKLKGYILTNYRLTCGWPCAQALGGKVRRLGECHGQASSKGGFYEIFVSPCMDDSLKVAGVVAHELLHAAVGIKEAHKGRFIKGMRHLGFKGKPTQAEPGEKLNDELRRVIESLGDYPHKALEPKGKLKKVEKKDTTLACVDCGCKVRISLRWIEEAGLPRCGCGGEFMESGNA